MKLTWTQQDGDSQSRVLDTVKLRVWPNALDEDRTCLIDYSERENPIRCYRVPIGGVLTIEA